MSTTKFIVRQNLREIVYPKLSRNLYWFFFTVTACRSEPQFYHVVMALYLFQTSGGSQWASSVNIAVLRGNAENHNRYP
jgi:hypothetical protein